MANGYDSQVTLGLVVDDSQLNRIKWPGDYTVHIKQEVDSSGLRNAAFLGDYTQTITQVVKQDESWRKAYFIGDRVATTTLQLDARPYLSQYNSIPKGNFDFTANGQLRIRGQQDVAQAFALLASLPSEYYVDGKFNGKDSVQGVEELTKKCSSLADVMGRLNTMAVGGDKTAKNLLGALTGGLDSKDAFRDLEQRIARIRNMASASQMAQIASTANWQKLTDMYNYGKAANSGTNTAARFGFLADYRRDGRGFLADIENQLKTANAEAQRTMDASDTLMGKVANIRTRLASMQASANGKFTLSELSSGTKNPYQDVLDTINRLESVAKSGKLYDINEALRGLKRGGGVSGVLSDLKAEYTSMMNLFKNKTKAQELGISEKELQDQTKRLNTLRSEYVKIGNTYTEAFKKGGTEGLVAQIEATRERMSELKNEINSQATSLRTLNRINNYTVEQYQELAIALEHVKNKIAQYTQAGVNDKTILEPLIKAQNYIESALNGGTGQVAALSKRRGSEAINALIRQSDKAANWMQRYEEAVERGAKALAKLQNQQERGLGGLMETASVQRLKKAYDELVASKGKALTSAESDRLVQNLNAAAREADLTAARMRRANLEVENYIKKVDQATAAQQRHSNIVGDLGQMIAQTYSVYQLKSFLTNLVEIGGQFAYQRAAIGHILDDTGKANDLFNKIKNMALKSPFNTIQLDQWAKELSSFDVEYNELFPKLKKLADISAGVGVDMSRIILAYGHVQATGYLEGMQRRQFSNANINILKPLAKLYQEREGVSVSTKDVLKRISEKRVSAEDLDKVLMAMAEPGGQFYNMQEAMAGTTKAVWKNLGDAINHMYMGIEEQTRPILTGVGLGLTEFTKTVVKLVPLLSKLAMGFGILKLAQYSVREADEKSVITRLQTAQSMNKEEANTLRLAKSYRELSEAELIAMKAGKAITEQQFQMIVLGKKLSKEEANAYKAAAKGGQALPVARQVMTEAQASAMLFGNFNATDEKSILQQLKKKGLGQGFAAQLKAMNLISEEQELKFNRSFGRKGPNNTTAVETARIAAAEARIRIEQKLAEAVAQEGEAEVVRGMAVSESVKNDLLKMAATGKMDASIRQLCLDYGILTKEELDATAAGTVFMNTAKRVGTTAMTVGSAIIHPFRTMKNAFRAAGAGIVAFGNVASMSLAKIGLTIKTMFVEFLPFMLVFAALEKAIEGIGFAWDKAIGNDSDDVKTRNEAAAESYRSLAESIHQVNDALAGLKNGFADMSPAELKNTIDTMVTSLKDNNPFALSVLQDIFKTQVDENGNTGFLKSQVEQAEELKKKLEEARDIQERLRNGGNSVFEDAAEWGGFNEAGLARAGGDWTPSKLSENIITYSKQLGNLTTTEQILARQSDRLKKKLDGITNTKFREKIDGSNKSLLEQLQILRGMESVYDRFKQDNEVGRFGRTLGVAGLTEEKGVVADKKLFDKYFDQVDVFNTTRSAVLGQMDNWVDGVLHELGIVRESIAKTASDPNIQFLMQGMHRFFVDKGMNEEDAKRLIQDYFDVKMKVKVELEEIDKGSLEGWKKSVLNQLEGGSKFRASIAAAPDILSARDAAVSLYKEAKERVAKLGKLEMGATFKVSMNKASIKSQIDDLEKKIYNASHQGPQLIGAARDKNERDIEIWRNMLEYYKTMYEGFDQFEKDPDAQASWQKSKGNKNKTDDKLKTFNEEVSAIHKLISTYNELKRTLGEVEAIRRLNESGTEEGKVFADIFGGEALTNERILEILNARLATAKQGGKDKKGWENAAATLARDIFSFKNNNISDEISRLLNAVERELDKRKGRLNIWEKVFDATLDRNLASKFAFGLYDADTDLDNLYLFDKSVSIIEEFDKKMEKIGEKHTFESLSKMSDKAIAELSETVKKEFPATVKAVEDAKNAQKEQIAGIIGNYVDLSDKFAIERKKAQREIDLLQVAIDKGMVDKDYGEETKRRIMATVNKRELEASYEYMQFFNAAEGVYRREFDDIGNNIRKGIVDQMAAGIIEAKEYIEQLNKIDDILEKNRKALKNQNGFRKFFNVGSDLKTRLQNEASLGRSMANEGKAAIMGTQWFKGQSDYFQGIILKAINNGTFTGANLGSGVSAEDIETIKEAVKKIANGNEKEKSSKRLYDNLQDASDWMQVIQSNIGDLMNTFSALREMMDVLGIDTDTGASMAFEAIGESLGGFASAGAKLASGDYIGGALDTITTSFKLVSSLCSIHDRLNAKYRESLKTFQNMLDTLQSATKTSIDRGWGVNGDMRYIEREREELQRRRDHDVGKAQSKYDAYHNRGGTEGIVAAILNGKQENKWKKRLKEYTKYYDAALASLEGETAYDVQYNQLLETYENKKGNYESLLDDKNVDLDQISDARKEVNDALAEVEAYGEEVMKNLFGIDFRSWAGTLTDTLVTAFANGEDAALAWQSAVDNIVRDVAKNMIQKLFIEKEMEKIYEQFLGDGGEWRTENGGVKMLTAEDTTKLHDALSNMISPESMEAMRSFMQGVNDLTWAADASAGGSLTKIGQSLTEETGSQIGGYLNNINGNVSAMRGIADAQLQQLNMIASNTALIAYHIERMASCTEHIDDLHTSVVNGTKTFSIG